MSRLDVVVPTYQNRGQLIECLDALCRQTMQDFRVLICVDGSTDGTVEYARTVSLPFEVRILEHPDRSNHGRAAARNLALSELTAPYVLFLDSDMRLEPEAVPRHLNLLSRERCVSVGDVVYERRSSDLWARYVATRGKNKVSPGQEIRSLDFNTQNAALPREDLLTVGGFDESLTGYGGEDTELGMRLALQRGLRLVFNAAARARSVEEKSVQEGLDQLDLFARTNLRTIRARHPDGPAPFWIDRLTSDRASDRLVRICMNPVSDGIARLVLGHSPFILQRRALDYLVLRTIWRGYAEGPR